MTPKELEDTRASWNFATKQHNAHKRDQAAFLRGGGSTLFPDEVELLGDVSGKRLLHLCCNAGQDSLSLVQRGAIVTGVDLSDEAIGFATALSRDAGLPATFLRSEANAFFETTAERFDVIFFSYGVLGWFDDLPRLMKGCARVLSPGGRLVGLEIHPLVWSFGEGGAWKDPYFAPGRDFDDPVSNYVGEAAGALSPSGHVAAPSTPNPNRAHSWQHTVADIVTAVASAGLQLELLREYPYANGFRPTNWFAPRGAEGVDARRFVPPVSLPVMLGLTARKTT